MKENIRRCIVKQSSLIKKVLKQRIDELGLTYAQIIMESERFGIDTIKPENLSRYFKGGKGGLTQENIVYLSYRYGIDIQLIVGNPVALKDGKIQCSIPKYNEKDCIAKVKSIFPQK